MGRLTGRGAAHAPRIQPLGDAALLVTFGDRPDRSSTSRAHALAAAIDATRDAVPGLGRAVPAHASVLVPFDPLQLDAGSLDAELRALVDRQDGPPGRDEDRAPPLDVPVRYGGERGPDLDAVANVLGLRPADVAELHASARFVVLFLGFAPGFAYLGGLPPELVTPRRATARERVPAGSVAIAGEHSAIYPRSMPGGWNLIGRTDVTLFDPRADPPTPLHPGRVIRFVPR